MINVTVNGSSVEVEEGSSVLDAVNVSGTPLPQLCKDPDMKPIGACRTCLVDIEGTRGYPASCSTPCSEGMVVSTRGSELDDIRQTVIGLTTGMVSNFEYGSDTHKELSTVASTFGIAESDFEPRQREPVDSSNPVFNIAMDSCILCGRCARACQQGHQFIGAIDVVGTATDARIATFMDKPLIESICTTCGQCLSVCPTGAISTKEVPEKIVDYVKTTCPYCGVGCGIVAGVGEDGIIQEMLDDPDNLSSLGMLCVKGRFGYTFVHHEDRITSPLIRRNGVLVEATWEEALDHVAEKLTEYRGDSFGTLCSAKATNEDGYIQQKFARVVMKSNHIDHCTRLCHSPSVEAMLESLGSGATSNSYIDYEEAGCLVIIGSDANSNHPVAASRMRRAVIEHGAKLIVINPRRIDMCDFADLWLRPRPGTDVALLNGIANVILSEGLEDISFIKDRTEGFDDWKKVVEKYDPEYVETVTGVSKTDIIAAARMYASPPFSGSCLIWGMGITQHTMGTANAHGLLNLSFVSGQLGKPGSGISPLRGQNNVQGCGDAGCIPNAFPGYQPISEDTVEKFSAAWGGVNLPAESGLVVTDMVPAIDEGRIKAMYVTGENPLLSEPDLAHAEKSFRSLEFLVVQDIFLHETAQIADVVLPACSFAEKDGSFTNSERRVQRVRKVLEPVGNSKADWAIFCELAEKISSITGEDFGSEFSYAHPSEIWDEFASLTPLVAGINYQRLENGGIQWPCPTDDHPGTRYLYEKDFPRGDRAKFVAFEQGKPADELPTKRFPLILNTGRILYHWHGGTITRRAHGLLARASVLQVAINPDDCDSYGLTSGDKVRIKSRRGQMEAEVLVSEKMNSGEIFVPFVKLQEQAANFLTNAALDPDSRIPEYKVCAVRMEKI
ncbi:MAG: formate dehydrogenase subunit alpha [Chloroflexota bacterium]|nr:formate dehydrogenase subunit alpha [Chloroflexota bacterium]